MDPFFDSLATALGGQAAVALGTAAKSALEKVRGLLRRRSEDTETLAALEAAVAPGAQRPQITALAERLDRVAGDDPDFREQLREAGGEVHKEMTASGHVVNQNSGDVRNLVQTNEIRGDITFN